MFKKHIHTRTIFSSPDGRLIIEDRLERDKGKLAGSVIFTSTADTCTVSGDYGNYVFDRPFIPTPKDWISRGYADEKLKMYSLQNPYEFCTEATEEAIAEMKTEEWTEEVNEWLERLEELTDDKLSYEYAAYREKPDTIDYEQVPYGEKRHKQLDIVYDAFDEICSRLSFREPPVQG